MYYDKIYPLKGCFTAGKDRFGQTVLHVAAMQENNGANAHSKDDIRMVFVWIMTQDAPQGLRRSGWI